MEFENPPPSPKRPPLLPVFLDWPPMPSKFNSPFKPVESKNIRIFICGNSAGPIVKSHYGMFNK